MKLHWVERVVSLLMAAGLGYMVLGQLGQGAILVAGGLVFFGAAAKLVIFAIANRRQGKSA